MTAVSDMLEKKKVAVAALYLDPNNYRLFDFETMGQARKTDEEALDQELQATLYEKIMDGPKMPELCESIRGSGGPVERPIVATIEAEDEAFLVVEGNRRTACLKSLAQLSDSHDPNFDEVTVEVIKPEHDSRELRRLIVSVRHISGIQEWSPYQQAQVIKEFRQQGKQPNEIKQLVGETVHLINRRYRAVLAFEQFRDEYDTGETDSYSYFEEMVAKPKVGEFVGWDDTELRMKSEGRWDFYGWITPPGPGRRPKLRMAIDVRSLPRLLENEDAIEALQDTSLEAAMDVLRDTSDEMPWTQRLGSVIKMLQKLPRNVGEEIRDDPKLLGLFERIEQEVQKLREEIGSASS